MQNLNILFISIVIFNVFLIRYVNGLSKYCSGIGNFNHAVFRDQFENCRKASGKFNLTSNDEELLAALENASKKANSTSSKHETKRLVLDLVQIVNTIKDDSTLKFCMRNLVCNIFKNCELPMEIQYDDWNNDAMVAARLASILTSFTFNERYTNYNTTDLPIEYKLTLYSLLKSAVEYENIYDVKIVSPSGGNTRFAFEATKFTTANLTKVRIQNMLSVLENTKNFYWYYKWIYEVKSINWTRTNLNDLNDEYNDLNTAKLLQVNNPTVNNLNRNYRYVSGVTYDCANAMWNRVVSVPFMYPTGEVRGVVAISITLNKFDLKQCGDHEVDLMNLNATESNSSTESKNPFYGTDKCEPVTTQCVNIPGKGFVRGSYLCKCRDGYYNPTGKEFLGIDLEHHYLNVTPIEMGSYDPRFQCKKCSKGCDTCNDSRPCESEISKDFKHAALIINLTCILICIILVILTWYHMTLKVLKTSSPKMLFMVLLGAIISYMEIIPMYFEPNLATCMTAQALQLEGFLMAYGALVLKTWRECKLFYVRSVKTIKITDGSLFKRLIIILTVGATFLAAWLAAVQNRESRNVHKKRDQNNLKYDVCETTFWNFISMGIQLGILSWGVVLSVQVRRASISFKETKLITWAIFNEGVVCFFVISVTVLLQYTNVSVYVPFCLNFIRMHLAITVLLILLFSYKIYTIIVARKKPIHSSQSSGLFNSFSISSTKEADQQNLPVAEETDKEREMRDEIQKLYRQIEEMRSLSMRIANPHLVPKKQNRFMSYQAKKFKASKSKVSTNENSKIQNDHESQFLNEPKTKLDLDSETSVSAQTVKFKLKS